MNLLLKQVKGLLKEEEKNFEDSFELWIATDPTNPAGAVPMSEFEETLKAGDSSTTYYLYIKMKETAGNTYQKKTYTGIGVTVYAVQGNVDI